MAYNDRSGKLTALPSFHMPDSGDVAIMRSEYEVGVWVFEYESGSLSAVLGLGPLVGGSDKKMTIGPTKVCHVNCVARRTRALGPS